MFDDVGAFEGGFADGSFSEGEVVFDVEREGVGPFFLEYTGVFVVGPLVAVVFFDLAVDPVFVVGLVGGEAGDVVAGDRDDYVFVAQAKGGEGEVSVVHVVVDVALV